MKILRFLMIPLLCFIVGFAADLNATTEIYQPDPGSYLSYDSSYQMGLNAGQAAAAERKAYDDTVPFICDAGGQPNPSAYKAGYKAGYDEQRGTSTQKYLDYNSSYQIGRNVGMSHVVEGKAYDDTVPFICDAGGQPEPSAYKAGYKAGYDEQKAAGVYLDYSTSYQIGYKAGKKAGVSKASYSDTPIVLNSGSGAQPEPTAYKTGYYEGYVSGSYDALNKRQDSASDPWGYAAGYIAAGSHAGYNSTPPDSYASATDAQKANYQQSYHTGYFDAVDDLVKYQTGKYKLFSKNAKGDAIYQLDNGTLFCKLANGWIYIRNGKIAISLAPDGTAIGGVVVADDGKGNYTWQNYDGSKTYSYANGSYYYVSADGKYWEYFNASASTRVLSDGSWEYNSPDGTTYIYCDSKGKITTYINGVKQ